MLLRLAYGRNNYNTYTVPSAGGTYPITLLISVRNVENLDSGLYLYDEQDMTIQFLFKDLDVTKITMNEDFYNNSSFSIHFIASPELISYKYTDRGYRFINLECGHIAQNLSLLSNALNLQSICSGGFLDGDFIDYLNYKSDNKFENYLYIYEMFFDDIQKENK